MALQPDPSAKLSRIVPILRRHNDWGAGLYEYPDSGHVPEDGLQLSDNLGVSEDGSIIQRPFLQTMATGFLPVPDINNRLVSFQYDGSRFYAYATGNNFIFEVALVAEGHSLSGLNISLPIPGDIDGIDLLRSVELIYLGGLLLVYSKKSKFFYVIVLSRSRANVRALTWEPLAIPKVTNTTVIAALIPGENDRTYRYYYRLAWRNVFNQTTKATEPHQIDLSFPIDSPRVPVGVIFEIDLDYVPSDAYALDLYIGDEAYREGLWATYSPPHILDDPDRGRHIRVAKGLRGDPTRLPPENNSTEAFYPTLVKLINGRLFLVRDGNTVVYGPVRVDVPEEIGPEGHVIAGIVNTNIFDFSDTTTTGTFRVGRAGLEVVGLEPVDTGGKLDELVIFTGNALSGEVEPRAYEFTPGPVYTAKQGLTNVRGIPQLYFSVTDIPGQKGTVAPDSIVNYYNSIFYWADDGVRVIGDGGSSEISQAIRGSIREVLNNPNRNLKVPFGFYYNHHILWSIPNNTNSASSRVFALDLQSGRRSWTVWDAHISAVAAIFEPVTSESILGVRTHDGSSSVNAKFQREYNEGCLPFSSHFRSARLRLETGQSISGYVLNVLLQLYRIRGDIEIFLYGQTDTGGRTLLASRELFVRTQTTPSGWGESMFSNRAWGALNDDIIQSRAIVNQERVSLDVFDSVQWLEVEIITKGTLRGLGTPSNLDDTPNSYSLGEIEVQFLPNFGDLGSSGLNPNIYSV